ncbi:hypothetical protein [uncultured Gimesia sp.]|jgi:hypothetical protein|uniref:hypothetical protein n=1 Tax=uncultured Gimesia sp. TaxID=1678688 RepID=UPI0026271354|nr:hypothetical protein [uncultured Gimesia sp.]
MRFPVILVLLNLLSGSATAADPPSQEYEELGFKTIKVYEYKKALREEGAEIPSFPLKTANALIVDSLYKSFRAGVAGLKDDDLIIAVNGKTLRSFDEGDKLLQKIIYKDELKLKVIRRVENKWNWIDVTIEPVSEQDYLRSFFTWISQLDDTYRECMNSTHHEGPRSKFTDNNIRLYLREQENEPLKVYLQVVKFLPRESEMLDELTVAGFLIQTDQAK